MITENCNFIYCFDNTPTIVINLKWYKNWEVVVRYSASRHTFVLNPEVSYNTGECTDTFFLKYLCQPAGTTGFNIGGIKFGKFFLDSQITKLKTSQNFPLYGIWNQTLVFSIEHNKSLPTRGVTTNALKNLSYPLSEIIWLYLIHMYVPYQSLTLGQLTSFHSKNFVSWNRSSPPQGRGGP